MNPRSPAAILFDLDGTLVDTVRTRIEAWLQAFDQQGLPADRTEVAALIGADGKRLARAVADAAGVPLDDGAAERLDASAGAIYESLNADPRPLPGARETLAELDRRGVRWAIATSSRRAQVGRSVGALRLASAPQIVDGSHVEHAKPEPDLLLQGASTLDVAAAECWYVGDSTWDMRAAVAAGMLAIGVTSGAVDEDELRRAGAGIVLTSLSELPALLSHG